MINIKVLLRIKYLIMFVIQYRFKRISGLRTAITFYVYSMYFLSISIGKTDVTWVKIRIFYDCETEATAAC